MCQFDRVAVEIKIDGVRIRIFFAAAILDFDLIIELSVLENLETTLDENLFFFVANILVFHFDLTIGVSTL